MVILQVTCMHFCQSLCVIACVYLCVCVCVCVCVYALRYLRAVFHESTLTDGFFQEPQSLCQVLLPPPQGAEPAHDSTASNKLSINQTDRRISVITAISVNPVWSEQKIVAMARQVENSPNTFTSNFLIYMHTNAQA